MKPEGNNATKFELFFHNFLPFCEDKKVGVLIVDRKDEFAPVKNLKGADSPQTAKALVI
jgi:UDP-N-acetylglucosamine pyrophosphorylase